MVFFMYLCIFLACHSTWNMVPNKFLLIINCPINTVGRMKGMRERKKEGKEEGGREGRRKVFPKHT